MSKEVVFWSWVLLPYPSALMLSSHSEGRGLVLSAVLCTKFFISPGLAKLGSLLCMERQSSSTFCGKSSGMDVPEELCHQFPAHLTALVRPFNFWTILCLIYLDDLLWGIFSQTKDEPGAMNCFVSLLRAAFNETMQQKRAGFENLWQMAKGQIFFVGFFFFLQICPWLVVLKESLRAAAG